MRFVSRSRAPYEIEISALIPRRKVRAILPFTRRQVCSKHSLKVIASFEQMERMISYCFFKKQPREIAPGCQAKRQKDANCLDKYCTKNDQRLNTNTRA